MLSFRFFKSPGVLLAFFVLATSSLQAGQPQPVSGVLGVGQNYLIPAGKILLLDCLSFSGYGTQAEVGGAYIWGSTIEAGNKVITFPRPLKLPAGSKIQIVFPSSGAFMSYYGTLIDTADFYVLGPAAFDSVTKTNGALQAKLTVNDKAPALVRIEKSEDLKNWQSDTNTPTTPKRNETNLVLNINTQQTTNAFFRARILRSDQ